MGSWLSTYCRQSRFICYFLLRWQNIACAVQVGKYLTVPSIWLSRPFDHSRKEHISVLTAFEALSNIVRKFLFVFRRLQRVFYWIASIMKNINSCSTASQYFFFKFLSAKYSSWVLWKLVTTKSWFPLTDHISFLKNFSMAFWVLSAAGKRFVNTDINKANSFRNKIFNWMQRT